MDETPSGKPPPQVPAGTVVYAVGDIHGCKDLLVLMLDLIRKDREERAGASDARRCVVVYIGDYVDRGPDSKGVIDLLLSDPLEDVETVFLRGNHEEMMRKVVADPESRDIEAENLWGFNGGHMTAKSYRKRVSSTPPGEQNLNGGGAPVDNGAKSFSGLGKLVPETHKDFLKGLALHHTEGSYLFVHAGIRPGVPLGQQTAEDRIWIREPFLGHKGSHDGWFVVHGHTPVEEVEVLPNRICIDTCAFASGVLTALVLEGTGRRFLQTPRDEKSRAVWY